MHPRVLSQAQSVAVANTQTGYIVASRAWFRTLLRARFSKQLDVTLTVPLTLTLTLMRKNQIEFWCHVSCSSEPDV